MRPMNKKWIVFAMLVLSIPMNGQRLALKTNLLYSAVAVPNLGLETSLSSRLTLDLSGAYNPFQVSETKKWKLWMVQPELRYWMCENFYGTFLGVHVFGGQFNVGGIGGTTDLPLFGETKILSGLKNHRVEGDFAGVGLSLGRQWVLSSHWSFETELGVGFARYSYDRFRCTHCGERISGGTQNYLGPTKAGISLVYMIR